MNTFRRFSSATVNRVVLSSANLGFKDSQLMLMDNRQYKRDFNTEILTLKTQTQFLTHSQLQQQILPQYWSLLYADLLTNYSTLDSSTLCQAFQLAYLPQPFSQIKETQVFINETKLMFLSGQSQAYYSEFVRQRMSMIRGDTLWQTSLNLAKQVAFMQEKRIKYPLKSIRIETSVLEGMALDSHFNADLMVCFMENYCKQKYGRSEFKAFSRIAEVAALQGKTDLELVQIALEKCVADILQSGENLVDCSVPPVVHRLLSSSVAYLLLEQDSISENYTITNLSLQEAHQNTHLLKQIASENNSAQNPDEIISQVLIPTTLLLLNRTSDDQLEFYCTEGLRTNLGKIPRQSLEPLVLESLELNTKFGRELNDMFEIEVIRRWPVLSCQFRHDYRLKSLKQL